MRKSILVGLGLALSFAGTAMAQQARQDAPRRDTAERAKAPDGRAKGRGGPDGFLLRGITLTEAQKSQLQALRKSERDKMQSGRNQMKKQSDEVRAARERGDTAAASAIMLRNRLAMEQRREQHVAAMRAILTAEQGVQFDKNVAELKQRQAQHGERGLRGGQRGRLGQPGPRGGDARRSGR